MKSCVLFSMLLLCGGIQTAFSAVIKEVPVPSKLMKREMKISVVLPDSYESKSVKKEKRYPVVYLLHGHGDDQSAWVRKAPVTELADEYDLIFVCPNGLASWYFDSFTDPLMKMESHIVKEVIPCVDKAYRTINSRKGRAISGNSMGGHGALYLGARHPEVFGALGAMSGGVDFVPFPDNWNIKDNLGTCKENKERWKTHTALYLLPKTRKGQYSIIVSCGTEDFFLEGNKNLDKALTEAGIAHEFVTAPGGHNWTYWTPTVRQQARFFSDYFKGVKPSPAKGDALPKKR